MISVRFNDPDSLVSCVNFLAHAFPGAVERDGHVLALEFREPGLEKNAEEKVVERLLWAWRVSHDIESDEGVVIKTDVAQSH